MKILACKNCGSTELKQDNGIWVCPYCGSKFIEDPSSSKEISSGKQNATFSTVNSNIELEQDVARLLIKCRRDPKNARKYANLILDIDPDNREALDFL